MQAGGRTSVVRAIVSCPVMRVKAYLAAIPCLIEEEIQRKAYEIYISDSLKVMGKNIAGLSNGQYVTSRYAEIVGLTHEESRTPEQIVKNMKEKIARIGG